KLLWDCIGSEFGGRHELYERNYSGSHEDARIQCVGVASMTGTLEMMEGMADRAMSEYDLDGWTSDKFLNPTDVSAIGKFNF
ncbi:MAG: Pyoverdin chromophore biosynthetic protein pvcC, partial [Actinobacteria bacterium]|nr:Pyoverdin chromophore biosynthetic protein pvcC [Actinomycetota bacterium]